MSLGLLGVHLAIGVRDCGLHLAHRKKTTQASQGTSTNCLYVLARAFIVHEMRLSLSLVTLKFGTHNYDIIYNNTAHTKTNTWNSHRKSYKRKRTGDNNAFGVCIEKRRYYNLSETLR